MLRRRCPGFSGFLDPAMGCQVSRTSSDQMSVHAECGDGHALFAAPPIRDTDASEEADEQTEQDSPDLYQDPDFPAHVSSLFESSHRLAVGAEAKLTWKRPLWLSPSRCPSLYVDGTSRRDVVQGVLADCWLLSVFAAMAKRQDILHRVLRPEQVLCGSRYSGRIEVSLWRDGEWVSVLIDDRLPQLNGKYFCARSSHPDEFWVSLVEKAFAKLHGSYEAIEGGMPIEAMIDMTGGLAERFNLRNVANRSGLVQLYNFMSKSLAGSAFLTCSRPGDWRRADSLERNGLVQGHAYTITGLFTLPAELNHIRLIRVRNPWADKHEWSEAWSDLDSHWKDIPEHIKKAMGLKTLEDGEFWMDFIKDFCNEFEEVSICTLGPDFDHDGSVDEANFVQTVHGEWVPGLSAGGCRNDLGSFATNPQYLLTVSQPMEPINPLCHVIVSLSQKYCRKKLQRQLHQIGFCIYDLGSGRQSGRRTASDLDDLTVAGSSGPYINYRDIIARFELHPGHYIIVPATYEAGVRSQFMIRIFSQEAHIEVQLIP